ncbi:MAG: hypothetical protein ACREJT_06030, partial [Myxococcota bacterium]
KIVVSGSSFNGSDYDFAVVRYMPNGTLDTSFDTDGKVTTSIGIGNDGGVGVAIQTDGKIVVSGSAHNGSNNDVAVVRYNPNGTLDTSFDSDGRAVTAIGTGNDVGSDVAIQANGKIVVGGQACFAQCNGVVVRYATNGGLDATFNGSGYVVVPIQAGQTSQFNGVALQADGRIVASGFTSNGSNDDFGVARILGDPVCGDTVVESGEQCDDGNTLNGDCCSSTCQYEANSVVCRAAAGGCDLAEHCTGSSGTCPADIKSTAVCRTSAGACDVAESCNGVNNTCPADGLASSGVCRPAADVCDMAESCNGSGPNCPADAYLNSGVCRASAGACDVAESCDGSAVACPADAFQPGTVECRAASVGEACNVAEYCTGSSATCPVDGFAALGTPCRPTAGQCDGAEACTGLSGTCPTDGYLSSGECRPSAGVCDMAESCDGSGIACPTDAKSTAPCRP